jgi:hypothetical protein
MDIDITPFILEKRLWDALPNTPTGKGLFLYFTQGKTDYIGGLTYKTPEAFFLKAEERTIDRLIHFCVLIYSGYRVDDNILILNTRTQPPGALKDLKFYAKYIPYIEQRLRYNRTKNISDFKHEVAEFVNQQTRQLDSESFGNYIKGVLDRQGNRNFNRTFYYSDFDNVPKVGSRNQNNFFSTKISTET